MFQTTNQKKVPPLFQDPSNTWSHVIDVQKFLIHDGSVQKVTAFPRQNQSIESSSSRVDDGAKEPMEPMSLPCVRPHYLHRNRCWNTEWWSNVRVYLACISIHVPIRILTAQQIREHTYPLWDINDITSQEGVVSQSGIISQPRCSMYGIFIYPKNCPVL